MNKQIFKIALLNMFFILLLVSGLEAANISRYEPTLEKIRSGNKRVMEDIGYSRLENIIEAYRIKSQSLKTSFVRLFLLGPDKLRFKNDKYDDEVDTKIRKKASKALAHGILNKDPRVRLSCIHLLYKIGMDEDYVKKIALRSAKQETVDLYYDYHDIYGRVRTKSIRRELLRLIDLDSRVPLIEPVPTSTPHRYLYGSEHSLVTYDQTFTFEWGHLLGAWEYELFIDGEIIYIGKETICFYRKMLKFKTHNWYVVAKFRGKKPIKSRLNIIHIRRLTTPKLVINQTSKEDTKPDFNWDHVKGALTYELYLYGRGLLYKVMVPHGRELIKKYRRSQWDYSDAEFLPPSKLSEEEKNRRLRKLEKEKRKIKHDKRQELIKCTQYKPTRYLPNGNYLCYLIAKNGFQASRSEPVAFIVYKSKSDKAQIDFKDVEKKTKDEKKKKDTSEEFDRDEFDEPDYVSKSEERFEDLDTFDYDDTDIDYDSSDRDDDDENDDEDEEDDEEDDDEDDENDEDEEDEDDDDNEDDEDDDDEEDEDDDDEEEE